MALHNCDEVAVAGFGYDMNTPHAPLHYYETVKMSAIKEVRRPRRPRTPPGPGRLRVGVVRRTISTGPFLKQVGIFKMKAGRRVKTGQCLIYSGVKRHRPFVSHFISGGTISVLFERRFCERRPDRSAGPSVRRRSQCLRRIKDVTRAPAPVNHELSTMITFV